MSQRPVQSIPSDLANCVEQALAEDLGSGDITAKLIAPETTASAAIISREQAILCGIPWVNEVFRQVDPSLQLQWTAAEGETIVTDQPVLHIHGTARSILTGERTALNFLQTLSGTATVSNRYATQVGHTNVKLLDTRKTLPGLRTAQKYAVRVGGCHNHRMGLYDAFLIKENHIAACGSINEAIQRARQLSTGKQVEIEVQNLEQLEQALAAGADTVMLDNFELSNIVAAVALNDGRGKLEASGSINSDTLVKIAETGVDYISIGALTKNCKAIDFSLLIDQG